MKWVRHLTVTVTCSLHLFLMLQWIEVVVSWLLMPALRVSTLTLQCFACCCQLLCIYFDGVASNHGRNQQKASIQQYLISKSLVFQSLHMAWKVHYGSSFETSLAWCPHLPCPMLNFGQLWQASGIPITNWMMFIQEQLMLGRGIPVPTDIRWVTFGPLEAAGSSSICHTEMWSKTLRNMVSRCLESFRNYSVYYINYSRLYRANVTSGGTTQGFLIGVGTCYHMLWSSGWHFALVCSQLITVLPMHPAEAEP